jgi:glycosyltransferase involved in cell wall biosynthesis
VRPRSSGSATRVLHVVPSFGLGGMERIIGAIVDGTAQHCHHIILSLSGTLDAKVWIENGSAQYIPFVKPPTQRRFFLSLYRQVRNIRPQILMSYNWGAIDAIWLGRLARVQSILHSEHGYNIDEAKSTNRKRDVARALLYPLSSKVIVVSHDQQTLMKQKYHVQDQKVVFIPNGVDTQYYTPDEGERKHTRAVLGLHEQDVVLGFVGRLDPVKNLDFLLQVFALSVRQSQRLKLLIIGDGPERRRLENRCQQQNLQSDVVFTGQQERILPYLRALDIFLVTSLREQMPMTVLEAMAVGVPVVASNVGEIPYIVTDGIDGFVHRLDKGEAVFAAAVYQLLSPLQRHAFGLAARRKVEASFQQRTMINRYQSLLTELTV